MTEPYFSEDGITIYHGDCQDILFGPLAGAYFHLLLTDPPYGEADVWKGGGWGPHTAPEKQVERGKWDITPDRDWLTLMLTRAADSNHLGRKPLPAPRQSRLARLVQARPPDAL